ncbi:DUF6314 family protein [Sphingobacterium corticis]|uniref:DUF6314 family protein n=1 Tax=Sphingobacterium corticis TaxID=1812823 RepID=A0ABW5NHX6_9SPHI
MYLSDCRQQLSLVKTYDLRATSTKEGATAVSGSGFVTVEIDDYNNLIFLENGHSENGHGKFKSRNVYQWHFDSVKNSISLAHLRFGAENPVYLFDMSYRGDNLWSSNDPHLCDLDEYNGELRFEKSYIQLDWTIHKKHHIEERISCIYKF